MSLFKTQKPKGFEYRPRYTVERSPEERAAGKQSRRLSYRGEWERKSLQGKRVSGSTKRLLVILGAILILAWFFIYG